MIKKNTKIVFEGENKIIEDIGGIPLSKGEIITLRTKEKVVKFKVIKKQIECQEDGADLIANITYNLAKVINK